MNKKVTIQQQFEQSMTLLTWFKNNPQASFMRAEKELGMSVPQIRHELRKLTLCGLPTHKDTGFLIDINIGRTSAEVMQDAGLTKPINLSAMEAGVLLLSLEAVRSVVPDHRHAAVDSAIDKIRSLSGQQPAARALGETGTTAENLDRAAQAHATTDGICDEQVGEQVGEHNPTDDPTTQLADAIEQRRLVRCVYRSMRADDRRERLLIADHIGLIEGHLYLWAREVHADPTGPDTLCKDRHSQPSQMPGTGAFNATFDGATVENTHKQFNVERISDIRLDAPGSATIGGPQRTPAVNPDDPFGFDSNPRTEWATLALEPHASWMLEYYPMWHTDPPGGHADNKVYVHYPDTGSWLERFLIAHADNITPSAPDTLAPRVRQRAQRGLRAYSRS